MPYDVFLEQLNIEPEKEEELEEAEEESKEKISIEISEPKEDNDPPS